MPMVLRSRRSLQPGENSGVKLQATPLRRRLQAGREHDDEVGAAALPPPLRHRTDT